MRRLYNVARATVLLFLILSSIGASITGAIITIGKLQDKPISPGIVTLGIMITTLGAVSALLLTTAFYNKEY